MSASNFSPFYSPLHNYPDEGFSCLLQRCLSFNKILCLQKDRWQTSTVLSLLSPRWCCDSLGYHSESHWAPSLYMERNTNGSASIDVFIFYCAWEFPPLHQWTHSYLPHWTLQSSGRRKKITAGGAQTTSLTFCFKIDYFHTPAAPFWS